MRFLMLLLPLSLIACATTDPTISVETQIVKVPVAVPCKAAIPVVPTFSFDTIDPAQDIFEKTKILLSDRKLHLGYEAELLAALNSCVK